MLHRLGLSMIVLTWAACQAAAQPPDAQADGSSWRHAELHSRYAEMLLRLAEARLQKFEQINAALPGQIARTDIRGLRTRVGLLREQLAETRGRPHGYGFSMQRAAAHAAVLLAEQDLEAATAVNGRRADAIAPIDMRMLEIRVEVARLRAEIWDDPAFLASPTDVLQMQIDQLADQLHDVLQRVDNAPAMDRR